MEALTFKKDNIRFGLLLGFIAPLLGMVVYYMVKFFPTFSFLEYLNVFSQNKTVLTGISTISLIANVILFTVYVNTHRDKTARGIFVMTLIYGIFVLMFKLIA
ncbi:MAG TPA: hypothetical protein VIK74_01080 [Parasegetibacter sp.]